MVYRCHAEENNEDESGTKIRIVPEEVEKVVVGAHDSL